MKKAVIAVLLAVLVIALLNHPVFNFLFFKQTPSPGLVSMGEAFVAAAKAGDDAKVRELCESEASDQGLAVAHRLAKTSQKSTKWWVARNLDFVTSPEPGEGSISTHLSDSKQALMIFWNKNDDKYRIIKVVISGDPDSAAPRKN